MEKGLVVLFTARGATSNVVVAGPPKGDSRAYAEALNAWQAETGGKERVEYSVGEEAAAATIEWTTARFMNLRAERTYDTNSLLRRLEKMGTPVRAAVRVPLYASASGLGEPTYSTSVVSFYEIKPGLAPTRVVVELPASTPWVFWLFVAFVPICCISGLVGASYVSTRTSMPLEKRRKLYSKVALYPTFGAIALHAPFAFYLIAGRVLNPITDLWFGETSVAVVMGPFILLPLLVVMTVATINTKLEKRLFGPTEAEAATLPATPEPPAEKTAFDQRIQRLTLTVMGIGAVLWLGSFAFSMSGVKSDWVQLPRAIGFLAFLMAGQVSRLVLKRDTARFEGEVPDPELENLAIQIGRRVGVPVQALRVTRVWMEAAGVKASYSAKSQTVKVTQRARQVLDPGEIEFIVARELVAAKLRHNRQRLLWNLPGALSFAAPLYLGYLMANPRVEPIFPVRRLIAFIPLGVLWVLVTGMIIEKRQQLERDREALLITRDLAAAESALWKSTMSTPLPHVDSPLVAASPALAKRLEALRAVEL